MAFTADQLTVFFKHHDQMALTTENRLHLATNEGIRTVEDLPELKGEHFKCLVDKLLRRSYWGMPNPARPGEIMPEPGVIIREKSMHRLEVTAALLRYYEEIGRTVTPENIRWIPVGKEFSECWLGRIGLTTRPFTTNGTPPLVNRALPIIKWIEAFRKHTLRSVGFRNYPLAYVLRKTVEPPFPCPNTLLGFPHAADYIDVEAELIARAPHDCWTFTHDNSLVYHDIKKAVSGTKYADWIKAYLQKEDGRAAFEALVRVAAMEALLYPARKRRRTRTRWGRTKKTQRGNRRLPTSKRVRTSHLTAVPVATTTTSTRVVVV